jgi:hypothetical protein
MEISIVPPVLAAVRQYLTCRASGMQYQNLLLATRSPGNFHDTFFPHSNTSVSVLLHSAIVIGTL